MASRRVLVIDDDQDIREIVEISLRLVGGWEVLTATSGQEGLVIAQAAQPDAILLDLIMPKTNGIAIFQQLQANFKTQNIPTILLTGKAHPNELLKSVDLPLAGVINKPFKASDLVRKIQLILHWCD